MGFISRPSIVDFLIQFGQDEMGFFVFIRCEHLRKRKRWRDRLRNLHFGGAGLALLLGPVVFCASVAMGTGAWFPT